MDKKFNLLDYIQSDPLKNARDDKIPPKKNWWHSITSESYPQPKELLDVEYGKNFYSNPVKEPELINGLEAKVWKTKRPSFHGPIDKFDSAIWTNYWTSNHKGDKEAKRLRAKRKSEEAYNKAVIYQKKLGKDNMSKNKSPIRHFIDNAKAFSGEVKERFTPKKYRNEDEYAENYDRRDMHGDRRELDDKMIGDFMRSLVKGKKAEYENDDVLLKDFMARIKHDTKHGYDEDEDEVIHNSRPTGFKKILKKKRGQFDVLDSIMEDPLKFAKRGGDRTMTQVILKREPIPAEDLDTDYGMSFLDPTKSPRRTLKLKDRKRTYDKFDREREREEDREKA